MTEVWFYHALKTDKDKVVFDLVTKVHKASQRAYVHGHDEAQILALDQSLWQGPASSFLPHGIEGTEFDSRQPVLLGVKGEVSNQATVYIACGVVEWPDLHVFSRAIFVFDEDAGHKAWAQKTWKQLKSEDYSLIYWKQTDTGKWEKQI